MLLLDLTLPTPAENLALDEALLETAEEAVAPLEFLRLWEAPEPCVIIGRSSRHASEVRLEACRERGIPVLRRCSGGAAIVAGPGCLMYAVVLSYELRPALRLLDEAHRQILGVVADSLRALVPGVRHEGTSDLALDGRKFSGNSLRCKRSHLLYHGTLLYNFPLDLISECLASPPRQPDYRAGRPHESFVMNLPLACSEMRAALVSGWKANVPLAGWPRELTAKLAVERYSQLAWNERL
jgi:lipoate-protein ligase A